MVRGLLVLVSRLWRIWPSVGRSLWDGAVDRLCPLGFAPGEAYQFDWCHEIGVLGSVAVKVAHMHLCHSRMMFIRACPRETQEMVFDAYDRGFAFFKGGSGAFPII